MTSSILPLERAAEVVLVCRKHIRIPRKPPEMVLIVGPCRVGTTALSNVFARLGLTAYMQPIKSMRRAIEVGEGVVDWKIDSHASMVISKETLGPKTEAEFFDPVKELIGIGYPTNKIHVIGICRDPRATLASWVNMWGRVPIKGFIKSFKLVDRVLESAQNLGAKVTYYVQEAISANEPVMVMEKLFERTGILISDNPPARFIKGVKEGQGYHFRLLIAKLTAEQERALRKNKMLK